MPATNLSFLECLSMLLRVLLIGCLFSLSGCKESDTYSYLMLHPSILQQDYERCEESGFEGQNCDLVRKAGEQFALLVDERRENPETFGLKIIQAQQSLAVAADKLQLAKQNLAKAPSDSKNQQTVDAAEKDYHDQHLQMRILLKVIRATSFSGD